MLADLQEPFQQPLIDKSDKGLLPRRRNPLQSPKSGSMGLILGLVLLLLACAGGDLFLPAGPARAWVETDLPHLPSLRRQPGEGAAQIALENVRQYFVPNEKEGQLFIIEGKAVNPFPGPGS